MFGNRYLREYKALIHARIRALFLYDSLQITGIVHPKSEYQTAGILLAGFICKYLIIRH